MADNDDWADLAKNTEPIPVAGANKDMLRRALQLNPKMREAMSTDQALNIVDRPNDKADAAKPSAAKPSAPKTSAPKHDLAVVFAQVKADLAAKKQRLRAELERIQAEQKAAGPEAFERLCAAIVEIDPNLASLQTGALFQSEKAFLQEIGLTPKTFLERKQRRR